jgi:hypothetical protein
MIFKSLDTVSGKEEETEIRNVVSDDVTSFIQTWVTFYINIILKQPDFKYRLFPWNKIIGLSFTLGSKYKCFSAVTGDRLDGLISLERNGSLYIAYIATAPWNYYKIGKMRRIGLGLVYYTIKTSQYIGGGGEFNLTALSDAEEFYEKIGMVQTGNVVKGMKEYHMPKAQSELIVKDFKSHVVKD